MKPITYITFLIDKSSSMSPFRMKLRQVYRELLGNIQANAEGHDIRVRLLQFGTSVPLAATGFTPLANLVGQPLTYSPDEGSTRLYDAMIAALKTKPYTAIRGGARALLNKPQTAENVASLLVVLTDGKENASRALEADMKKAIAAHGDKLTVAMNVPQMSNARIQRMSDQLGIPVENFSQWDQTTEGLTDTIRATATATTSYLTATRAAGQTKSTAFYSLTPNLSGFDPKTANLANLHGKFMSRRINKEERIDEFVQRETGQPYLRGMAFYQLTKPEVIQGNKDILLREKGKTTVWGGPNARAAIGLQPFKDGKITPGNHANWDIFVQSLADNRKLVRGTDLLIRK